MSSRAPDAAHPCALCVPLCARRPPAAAVRPVVVAWPRREAVRQRQLRTTQHGVRAYGAEGPCAACVAHVRLQCTLQRPSPRGRWPLTAGLRAIQYVCRAAGRWRWRPSSWAALRAERGTRGAAPCASSSARVSRALPATVLVDLPRLVLARSSALMPPCKLASASPSSRARRTCSLPSCPSTSREGTTCWLAFCADRA